MKKSKGVNIHDVYHTIKSPIVSLKSILFVLGRNKDIEKNKAVKDKLLQMEDKVNLLHKRAEIFLNYILFKDEQIEFLYSFFDVTQTLQELVEQISKADGVAFIIKNSMQKPIMADQDQIKETFRTILNRVQRESITKKIAISIVPVGRNVEVSFEYTSQIIEDTHNKPINSDEQCIEQELDFIAEKIIEMHGGKIVKTIQNNQINYRVILPQKARRKSENR